MHAREERRGREGGCLYYFSEGALSLAYLAIFTPPLFTLQPPCSSSPAHVNVLHTCTVGYLVIFSATGWAQYMWQPGSAFCYNWDKLKITSVIQNTTVPTAFVTNMRLPSSVVVTL